MNGVQPIIRSNSARGSPASRNHPTGAGSCALLAAAARLFARRGFDGVSLEDLGSAAGVSGPAVYRHFPGKQAVLAALLVEVSQRLADGGRDVVAGAGEDLAALGALVPAVLIAVTVKLYAVPFARPRTVIGDPLPDWVRPPGEEVTV